MSTTTEALVLSSLNAPFLLQPLTLSPPLPHEVLLRITACGLCHTDLSLQSGVFPTDFPSIAGHEGSGVVLQVGSAVQRVKEGDHVLLSFASCLSCEYCKDDHPAGCTTFVERNFGRERHPSVGSLGTATAADGSEVKGTFFGQSSFARHAVVQESSCVKVPEGTDLVTLAPLGCGLQTGSGAVLNTLRCSPTVSPKNNSILITGLGAVGMAALFAAVYLKLGTIIVVDVLPSKLAMAKGFGAHHVLDGKDPEVVKKIKELTGGLGVKWAVEATGNTKVLEMGFKALSNFGHLATCGTPGPGPLPPYQIHDFVNESKTFSGVAEGDSNPPEFIPFLMKLYEEGHFPVDKISKTFPVEQFDDAVAAMKSGDVIKPIILF
ncbi:alcohol dehydrogenase [Leucosporidium creatinivorum]|uniref:Alcohol dehydrogenase n=1 Tax=Leucosporidium creatinivorum TaxID=106004 RepID=A0A1Y2FTW3_9BASI|nr:alcohol dehydrogenase [Leucosporidium creatinivorum]